MKCRGNRPTLRALAARALSFSAIVALMLNQAMAPVIAGDYRAEPATPPRPTA